MAMSGRAVHKNHTHTLYIYRVISLNHLSFIMNACPAHIFESTKTMKLV